MTCIASKLMEHIVTSSIIKHANDFILYDLQHRFRQHRLCETQLLQFVSHINENLHSKQQTDLNIMDFSKAFDKVGHQRLLRKLEFYEIKGTTNRWIASFLRDRKQSVVVEGEKSGYVEVLSVVPQGSGLGPSLFLFYINDICDNLSSTVRLFADDTICYLAIKTKQDSQRLNAYKSDHNIIKLSISKSNQKRGKGLWKFNNALLENNDFIDLIKAEILLAEETYALPIYDPTFVALDKGESLEISISSTLFIETLLCQLRGQIIKFSKNLKKKRNRNGT